MVIFHPLTGSGFRDIIVVSNNPRPEGLTNAGDTTMGKLESNKRHKENTLLNTAFEFFTTK